ncbi:energy-coupling factor transporter transmembrane component T [Phytoactinopolyspora mesophila]|uniref:Energy-coupling factor transporter transmembrane protein EcfT n=1 Tax=Phytoactinopolyspora mesophila TaxID=2650750 RepID=A0A7K3M1Y8_9ACTN|nr:energy-coupling factor transporter transmembrane component T [Phytoactinopolyspora mesophila]NDL57260.1 energy-coupling factor transporter transmembrane protein EcfT [Phytoactinopolyspora mesophila]
MTPPAWWSELRIPRALHAGAWWLWALGLAAAASRTTNPLLLALLIAIAAYVVVARRGNEPWSRSFTVFLKLGLLIILIRVVIQVVFTSSHGGTVLFRLPELTLPEWAAGVKIGGAITGEALTLAFYDGLRLAAILACIGAANALADARRLLRSVPGALYEAGVALVVAMTFAPRLIEDASRIRQAHRLRGRQVRGVRAVGRVGMPVLQGSLERSLDLAAAMDSRGFGRAAAVDPRYRRSSGPLVLCGLIGICIGLYGLLDGSAAAVVAPAGIGAGLALATAGLFLGSRGSRRTRYRPDPWRTPEWVVSASGMVAALAFVVAATQAHAGMNMMVVPLLLPGMPLLAAAGALVALAPAWAAPPPRDHAEVPA